jgi:all-trans-8'-apo-beta-carotenal 15,15'-oxygenase
LLGIENGPRMHLHLAEHSVDGALQRHQRIAAPRSFYIHDWFATEHYALVLLHPVKLSLTKFLSGWASFTDSLQWKPELGNLLLVIDREGIKAPIVLETSACFMWHSVNAFEMKDSIIADFVGYDEPDHFLGSNAAFKAIMQKKQGEQNYSGTVRRYLINLEQKQITEDVLSQENHEFPIINPRLACYRSRYGYFSTAPHSTAFHNGLARLDLDTGKRDAVHLGDDYHLGEPIFVPDGVAANEPGWLLSLGLDGKSGHSFLGIFRAERLADGPVARVLLNHSTPLSFHGWWHRHPV